MPGDYCELHGNQRALIFCDHAGMSVDERQNAPVYLQQDKWGWRVLCDDCIRRPDRGATMNRANRLVCIKCVAEWEECTGNDFAARCRRAQPEEPADL